MANYRKDRINDETQKALSLILREVKDPRVASAFVSITGAEVSGDLKFAKIYYSVLGAAGDDMKEKEKEVAKGLKSSTGFIRRRLAQELDLRQTPELSFYADHSIANGAHISSLLHGLKISSPEENADGNGGTGNSSEDGE